MIFERYDLSITDKEDGTCTLRIFPKIGKAQNSARRKVYVITNDIEVLYVGEANTSILKRLQRGAVSFNHYVRKGSARGGYKGYKWLNKVNCDTRNLIVNVATFDEYYDNKRDVIEAIEGELVYLIRKQYGYWPKFQNEIHFSNCSVAESIAKNILQETGLKEVLNDMM